MASLLSFPVIISALELGCIYALVALALFFELLESLILQTFRRTDVLPLAVRSVRG